MVLQTLPWNRTGFGGESGRTHALTPNPDIYHGNSQRAWQIHLEEFEAKIKI
jgi:hypothetical protein